MGNSFVRTNKEVLEIYNRHVDTVYRVCILYMKNKHDTEDMVQNTFIRLMRDNTEFQSEEHEKAWLIRTATNLCKDFFRSWWRKTVTIDHAKEVAVDGSIYIDDTIKKVMELPSKYKTTVYMYYYEGYSTTEISKILEKNVSTIKGYLHKGRKLLKIEMEGELR
jgi:RNA polymerase sigma-70 factor (ECF subfamily)